ncbi:MarR family winged helix-turn-helix transcriptional regulator [Massilia sp. YIM B04103]|uniref:MarR family winged helix-turn-helix transcriptional regulator n=1 Tax=Massilia sp. YIM B04103 TaxID=2963106 RepID=UPI00210A6FAF|nr:MarR family winged helix-turn-helix transcriptional regulator [Massilia sp. YIM B04103]
MMLQTSLAIPCTCFQLRKLTRTVTRFYDQRLLAQAGLKNTQFSLLSHVLQLSLPMARLAAEMGMERTTLTRNLRPMIEAGWIELQAGGDPRQRIVAITAAGREVQRAARPAWRAAQKELEALLGAQAVAGLHGNIEHALACLTEFLDGN